MNSNFKQDLMTLVGKTISFKVLYEDERIYGTVLEVMEGGSVLVRNIRGDKILIPESKISNIFLGEV